MRRIDRRTGRRIGAGLAAFLAVAAVLLAGAVSAWAPPAEGVPNAVVVGPRCVEYGATVQVAGSGFAPGTSVTVSAPQGHYTGPPAASTAFQDVTVQATATGGFEAALKAPPRPLRQPWSWQPRVIFATGTPQVGEGEGQSFDQVLIGTHQVCQALRQQHRSGTPKSH